MALEATMKIEYRKFDFHGGLVGGPVDARPIRNGQPLEREVRDVQRADLANTRDAALRSAITALKRLGLHRLGEA
jgi:hypothetical protein